MFINALMIQYKCMTAMTASADIFGFGKRIACRAITQIAAACVAPLKARTGMVVFFVRNSTGIQYISIPMTTVALISHV